jgi:protoheme ferro-lyase
MEPIQLYVLWAVAHSLPHPDTERKDTYHQHAMCSLKVKLYQRYLNLMR